MASAPEEPNSDNSGTSTISSSSDTKESKLVTVDIGNLSPPSQGAFEYLKNKIQNQDVQLRTIEVGGIVSAVLTKYDQQIEDKRVMQHAPETDLKERLLRWVNFVLLNTMIHRCPPSFGIYIDPNMELSEEHQKRAPKFDEENIIGRGCFGIVYKIPYNDKKIAVKVLTFSPPSLVDVPFMENEIMAWFDQKDSQGVPKLLAVEYDRIENKAYYYCEYLEFAKSLDEIEKFKQDLDKSDLADTFTTFLAKSLVQLLEGIHKTKWTHGDLGQRNIMVQANPHKDEILQLFIIDFSLAERLIPSQSEEYSTERKDVQNVATYIYNFKCNADVHLEEATQLLKGIGNDDVHIVRKKLLEVIIEPNDLNKITDIFAESPIDEEKLKGCRDLFFPYFVKGPLIKNFKAIHVSAK